MANERELLIVVKARDEANRVIQGTNKEVSKIPKTAKESTAAIDKAGKSTLQWGQLLAGLGVSVGILRRIIFEIDGVKNAFDNLFTASSAGIGDIGKLLDQQINKIEKLRFALTVAKGILGGFADLAGIPSIESAAQTARVVDAEEMFKQFTRLAREMEKVTADSDFGKVRDTVMGAAREALTFEQRVAKIAENTGVATQQAREFLKAWDAAAKSIVKVDNSAKNLELLNRPGLANELGKTSLDSFGRGEQEKIRKTLEKIRSAVNSEVVASRFSDLLAQAYGVDEATARAWGKLLADGMVDGTEAALNTQAARLTSIIETGFGAGFKNVSDDVRKEFEDLTKIGEQFSKDLFNTLADNFFRSAKKELKDFGDFAKSILSGILDSLLAILSRLASSQLLSLGGSLFGGGGNPLRDAVSFGQPYISGPGSSGGSSSSSSSAPITIHINAIDAQSFADAVQRNPGAIAAAATAGISRNNALRANLRGAIS